MTVLTYLIYLGIAVPLTLWMAQSVRRNGRIFLVEVFRGNEDFAEAVNRLLVVGFYLVNLGFVTLFLRTGGTVVDVRGVIEQLSVKVGIMLVVLGALHLLNVWIFTAIRRRSRTEERTAPAQPAGVFGPVPYAGPLTGTKQPMPSGY
jgi:hypothetical protein